MQTKLVTVYLDNSAYKSGKMLVTGYGDLHGQVEEHLSNYLEQGWTVHAITSFGGSNDGILVHGWIAAVLVK